MRKITVEVYKNTFGTTLYSLKQPNGLLSWMQLYLVCKMKFIFWLTKMYISGDIIDFQWADAIILKNALGGLMSYHWFSQY